jgi:AbrB family looped-hinge helix DNA binding protein
MPGRTRSSTRLSAKGQVVIPKAIRDASGWRAGLDLVVEAMEGGVLLRPRALTRARAAEELLGCTGYQGPRRSLAEMDAAIAREAKARR